MSLVVVLAGCLSERGGTVVPAHGNYRELSLHSVGGVDGLYESYTYVPATHQLVRARRFDGSLREQVTLTSEQAVELEETLSDIRPDTDSGPTYCGPDALELRLEFVDASGTSRSYRADRRYRCQGNLPPASFVRDDDFQIAVQLCLRLLSESRP